MRILVASPIEQGTIEELRKQHDTICEYDATTDALKELIQTRDILIFRSGVSITAEVMECAPNLNLLIRAGSGIDNLDLEYVRQRGLRLERVPGPSAQAVAEMAFAFMLAWSRRLFEADRSMREGRWAKYELPGRLLAGKVLGIVGAGNTGSRVGQVGAAWGMEVIGCVEHPSPVRAARFSEIGIRLTGFDEVISTADYVSVHVPIKDSTHYLFNADVFSRMKPGSFLVNLGRGGVVDEQALHKALTQGDAPGGAALDVHEVEEEGKSSPLADLSSVILTPHLGATVVDTQREIGRRICEIIDSYAPNGIS